MRRVLRAGGVLLAVAISRFAPALDGIARGLIRDPDFVRIVEHDLKTGQHRNERRTWTISRPRSFIIRTSLGWS